MEESFPSKLACIVCGAVGGALLAYLAMESRVVGRLISPLSTSHPNATYSDLIGDTRLIRISSLSLATGCEILGKAEFLNPGGSGKDRVALAVLEEAEKSGKLTPGGMLIEGTSGSTGISLTLLARSRGYRSRIFLPSDQSPEKAALLRRLGAEVVETPPVSIVHPEHYVNQARASAARTPNSVFVDQFENPMNTIAHYSSTGPEIWRATRGRVDAFVMGAGTGGTVGGVGRYLKETSRGKVKVFLVDPPGSVLLRLVTKGVAWAPQLAERTLQRCRDDTIVEGVGLDRVTSNVRTALPYLDGAWGVEDEEVVAMARHLLREDGIFCGSSTALNCVGAVKAARALGPGHTVVTILCDGGARHLSRFWSDEKVVEAGKKRGDRALQEVLAKAGVKDSVLRHWRAAV